MSAKTTNKTTARKLCSLCVALKRPTPRPVAPKDRRRAEGMSGDMDYCVPCYTEAGWENTHSDQGHDDLDSYTLENTTYVIQAELDAWLVSEREVTKECWICHPELNQASAEYVAKAGHHSPRRKQINHKACQHPQMPAMRRKCRDQYHAGKGLLVVEEPKKGGMTLTVFPARGQGTAKAAKKAPSAPYSPEKGDAVVYTTPKDGTPRTGTVHATAGKGLGEHGERVRVQTAKGGYVVVSTSRVSKAN